MGARGFGAGGESARGGRLEEVEGARAVIGEPGVVLPKSRFWLDFVVKGRDRRIGKNRVRKLLFSPALVLS